MNALIDIRLIFGLSLINGQYRGKSNKNARIHSYWNSLRRWDNEKESKCISRNKSCDEQKKLIFFLKDQFGLESTLNKDKIYFRIRVRSESSKKMVKIIDKYILPSFRYKLPLL